MKKSSYQIYFLVLVLFILCAGSQVSAQEKIQDGEANITADSYGDFLKEVGKQDLHHLFEEKNTQIKRLGTCGEYDYYIIKKEADPSPKLFMSTLDAICYSQWRNKKLLYSNKSSQQSSEHDFSYLDEEKSILIQESGVVIIASASLVPNNIDPLLKSNMISFKLRDSKLAQSEENSDSSQTYSNDSLWAIGAGTLGVLGLGYLLYNRYHSTNPNQDNEIDYKSVYKNAARDTAQEAAQRIERKQITKEDLLSRTFHNQNIYKNAARDAAEEAIQRITKNQITEESGKEHQYDSSSTFTTIAFASNDSENSNESLFETPKKKTNKLSPYLFKIVNTLGEDYVKMIPENKRPDTSIIANLIDQNQSSSPAGSSITTLASQSNDSEIPYESSINIFNKYIPNLTSVYFGSDISHRDFEDDHIAYRGIIDLVNNKTHFLCSDLTHQNQSSSPAGSSITTLASQSKDSENSYELSKGTVPVIGPLNDLIDNEKLNQSENVKLINKIIKQHLTEKSRLKLEKLKLEESLQSNERRIIALGYALDDITDLGSESAKEITSEIKQLIESNNKETNNTNKIKNELLEVENKMKGIL